MKLRSMLLGALALCATIATASVSSAEDDGGELVPMILTFLSDEDKDIRALAFSQVRTEAMSEAATKQFAAQLAKLPADGQIGLLRALADRGDKAARESVLELATKTEDADVKLAAVAALGPLGNSKDLPLLIAQLGGDGAADLKSAARSSLVQLSGEGVHAAIVDAMGELPAGTQVALTEILTTRRALDAIPALLDSAVGDDAVVRIAAMKALGQLASAEHLPGLVKAVLRAEAGKEREAAEKNVMFVCQRIADLQMRDVLLLEAVGKFSPDEQTVMLSTLGRVGGPAALKVVEAAIASDEAKQHEMGLRAICNWPNASVAPQLIALIEQGDNSGEQTKALRALIRIAPLPDGRTDIEKLDLLKQAYTLAKRDDERHFVLKRAAAVRIPETLRYLLPYVDDPAFAESACLSIVELAHHRGLREPNKAEFDAALDKVIATSKDAVVIDRAKRYKKDETWVRPK